MRLEKITLIAILLTAWSSSGARSDSVNPAVLCWSGFESADETAKWKSLGTTFEQSPKFATEGKSSARLQFRKYQGETGEDQWPRVTAFQTSVGYPADWSPWGAVAFDLTTDSTEDVNLALEIRDTAGKNGWVTRITLRPAATQRVVVPLSEPAKSLNLTHIHEFLLFMSRPDRAIGIYVDNVRLLHPKLFDMQRSVEAAAAALDLLWTRGGAGGKQRKALTDLQKAAASATMTLAQADELSQRAQKLQGEIISLRIKPLRAFDFGPQGSPVRVGFTGVTASTAYSAGTGFGWRTAEGLKELTRPAERKWTMNYGYGREIPPPVYLTDLTQDLVGGESPAEFAVNLPTGDYVVWLLAGYPAGYEPVVNNFTVDAGAGQHRIGIPQQHIWQSQFILAKAGHEGLTIRFVPETGFVVNALAVFSLKDLRRAEKEFAGPINHEVFVSPDDLWSQWRPVTHPAEKPAPEPSAEEKRRGYVLFQRPFVQNVYPDSQPQAPERFTRLEAFATPGEYEPFVFAIQALRDLDGVRVEIGDLLGPGGSRIAANSVDARQVRSWPVRTHYSVYTTYTIVPEILDPVKPTDLDARTCQRFWLTLHVPHDARPGFYVGQATVRADNAPASRVELRLEVLPIRLLRDPTKSFGNYYYPPLDKIRPGMRESVVAAIRQRAEAEARDMQEHGMSTLQMGGISVKKVDGRWEPVISLDDRIEFLRRFGLWGQAPGVMTNSFWVGDIYKDCTGESFRKHLVAAKMPPQAYFDAVTRVIGQIEKERIARGWPDFYYYPIDEASAEAISILEKTLEAIKKVPTAKTYATQIFELKESRPLDDVLDVWCSGYFCKDLDAVEAMRRKGRIFWCYPNFVACSRGVPNSARMTYGFALWRMGYSCLIPWHYQAPVGNPFCDFDATYGDWCMAYPGPDGPIPTQRWEGVREGIDDGRYIYTLEARIAEAKKKGASIDAVAAGEALLKEIRDAVPVQSTYEQSGPWKGPEYDSFRRRLAEAIMSFGK